MEMTKEIWVQCDECNKLILQDEAFYEKKKIGVNIKYYCEKCL